MAIRFDLRETAPVTFEILDVAGRLVSRLPAQTWSAGTWTADWGGQGDDGHKLGPGIYLVRMTVAGVPASTSKFAVLP